MPEEKTLSVGKHKQQPIGDVPDYYLVWLATREKVTNKEDQQIAIEELKARGKDHLLPSPVKRISPQTGMVAPARDESQFQGQPRCLAGQKNWLVPNTAR